MSPKAVTFVLPMPLDACTGGTIYDKRVVEGLRAREWSVDVVDLGSEALTPSADGLLVVDGLALGKRPLEARRWASAGTIVALVHHPLCDETGIEAREREALLDSEGRALAHARRTVTTSSFTRRRLIELGLRSEDDDVRVVEPGVDPLHPRAEAPSRDPGTTLRILTIGSLTPRKAYVDLARALSGFADDDWHWTAIGRADLDPDCAAELRRTTGEAALESRVTWLGEVGDARKSAEFERSDLFVHPAHYEGYGMVVREALAAGVPVICSTGGALENAPDVAARFEPGDVTGLANALRRGLRDPAELRAWTAAARWAPGGRRTWSDAATEFEVALEGLTARGGTSP